MTTLAHHMTRDDLDAVASRNGVAVIPVGALEQHGNHLPTGTDTLLAEAITREGVERVTERGTEAVVFPAIWTGFSPHHSSYGGTVTVQKETLLSLLDDITSSLTAIGFSKILFVNGHGGNKPVLSLATADVGVSQSTVDVGAITYFGLAEEVFEEIREGDHGSAYHAGEFETALMLHLYQKLVDENKASDDVNTPLTSFSSFDMFSAGLLEMRRPYDEITDEGVRGQPTKATAENGALLYDEICERLANLLEEFADLDRLNTN